MSKEEDTSVDHGGVRHFAGEGDAAHDGYPAPLTAGPDGVAVTFHSTPKAQIKPRLTVVEKVYFQSPDDEPVEASTSFSQEIESEEQPYSRKVTIKEGEDWKLLDFGWVANEHECSMMVLENKGKNPIEFRAYQSVLFTVDPGKSVRIPNLRFDALAIRCLSGTKYHITVFPK